MDIEKDNKSEDPLGADAALHADAQIARKVHTLQEAIIPLHQVDPLDTDFSDLAPLKALFADAQIVMLGEQTHTEGTVFALKSRLIKFLHQELGFSVLAFESDMAECHHGWKEMLQTEDSREVFLKSIYEIWSTTSEVKELAQYVDSAKHSTHPLELAGFDCQTWRGQARLIPNTLDDYEASSGIFLKDITSSTDFAQGIKLLEDYNVADFRKAEEVFTAFSNSIDSLISRIEGNEKGSSGEKEFALQLLRSAKVSADLIVHYPYPKAMSTDDDLERFQKAEIVRDGRMAGNLERLANEVFKGRKIIVWAASRHISSDLGEWKNPYGLIMGELTKHTFGDKVVAVGFTGHKVEMPQGGDYFSRESITIEPAEEGSIEDLMYRANPGLSALNMRGLSSELEWLKEPQRARFFGNGYGTFTVPNSFDLLFCLPESKLPSQV